jgi:hypothetical protein
MKLVLTAILYLTLAAVVYSCTRSVWLAFAEPARYTASFPGANGILYELTIGLSAAAALNAIAVGLGQRWAIWTNILIGVSSIVLFEAVHGSRVTEAVIAISCAITFGLPLLLWKRHASGAATQ